MSHVRSFRAAFLLASCLGAAALAGCASVPPQSALAGDTVEIQVLAFNDFHGTLDPPAGALGRIGEVVAGGAEYLATHIARLEASNPRTVIVAAGDNIGASSLLSAMFHDEPTVEVLSALGLDVSIPGNHEFDEGHAELLRMQRGGCHPTDGCQDGTGFEGAAFEYLSANVRFRTTGETLFPAATIRRFDGVPIGFIGLALETTPALVTPSGVASLEFVDPAEAANAAAKDLRARGVHAIVAIIHEGVRWPADGPRDCTNLAGPILPILERMSEDIGVVVSGHSHEAYVCTVAGRLLTSAASSGRLVTDIDLTIDRATGRIVSARGENVPVTRDVPPKAEVTAILDRYRPIARAVAQRPVGSLTADLVRVVNAAGESGFGDVVADSFLEATRDPSRGGAQLALVNRAGIRMDLVRPDDAPAGQPFDVEYGDVFAALPYGNEVIVKTMTGAAIVDLLEQQFDFGRPGFHNILQVSRGFTYDYDPARPGGARVNRQSLAIEGETIRPEGRYRVAMANFIWNGGEGFTAAASGVDPVVQGTDVEALLEYLRRHSPVAPGPQDRIRLER